MLWLKGLIAALIGGAANGALLILVDPVTFNLDAGLRKLATVTCASAATHVAMYLKQSPVPKDDDRLWR